MHTYTSENILKIAKRYGNVKRSYLLVNPLQAKHVPVDPAVSLSMMETLGKQVRTLYPQTKIVIGFAETATAIGASVASCLEDCIYVQTTREEFFKNERYLCFQEEHSHAVEQKLCSEHLQDAFEKTDTVVLVDDEISTGKTLINIIKQIKQTFPCVENKKFVAVSLINRVSAENMDLLLRNGIACEYLVKIPNVSYDEMIAQYSIHAPSAVPETDGYSMEEIQYPCDINPRKGVSARVYENICDTFACDIDEKLFSRLSGCASILVLGTEEYMYPALKLAKVLKGRFVDVKIRVHATTRSPIGVCDEANYPIQNGYAIHSFYDKERQTFIYNVAYYDAVIICSDAPCATAEVMSDICRVFGAYGCKKFFFVRTF